MILVEVLLNDSEALLVLGTILGVSKILLGQAFF